MEWRGCIDSMERRYIVLVATFHGREHNKYESSFRNGLQIPRFSLAHITTWMPSTTSVVKLKYYLCQRDVGVFTSNYCGLANAYKQI